MSAGKLASLRAKSDHRGQWMIADERHLTLRPACFLELSLAPCNQNMKHPNSVRKLFRHHSMGWVDIDQS